MVKKIFSVMVLTLAFAQLALAANVDTGYIVDGIDNMTGVKMLNGQMVTLWTHAGSLRMLNNVTMENGTLVMPTGYVIMANGVRYWMKEDWFMNFKGELTGNLEAQPTYSTGSGTHRVTTTLNIRSWAGIGTNIIGHFTAGTMVDVLGKSSSGYWCKVSYKNYSNAWVACKYLAQ